MKHNTSIPTKYNEQHEEEYFSNFESAEEIRRSEIYRPKIEMNPNISILDERNFEEVNSNEIEDDFEAKLEGISWDLIDNEVYYMLEDEQKGHEMGNEVKVKDINGIKENSFLDLGSSEDYIFVTKQNLHEAQKQGIKFHSTLPLKEEETGKSSHRRYFHSESVSLIRENSVMTSPHMQSKTINLLDNKRTLINSQQHLSTLKRESKHEVEDKLISRSPTTPATSSSETLHSDKEEDNEAIKGFKKHRKHIQQNDVFYDGILQLLKNTEVNFNIPVKSNTRVLYTEQEKMIFEEISKQDCFNIDASKLIKNGFPSSYRAFIIGQLVTLQKIYNIEHGILFEAVHYMDQYTFNYQIQCTKKITYIALNCFFIVVRNHVEDSMILEDKQEIIKQFKLEDKIWDNYYKELDQYITQDDKYTPIDTYIDFILGVKHSHLKIIQQEMVYYLYELSLYNLHFLKYSKGLIISAAFYLTKQILKIGKWDQDYFNFTNYSMEDIKPVLACFKHTVIKVINYPTDAKYHNINKHYIVRNVKIFYRIVQV